MGGDVVDGGPQEIQRFENFHADGGVAVYLLDKVRRQLRFVAGKENVREPYFPDVVKGSAQADVLSVISF